MHIKICYLLLPFITLSLIGEAKETSSEVIILECSGKTSVTESSTNWKESKFYSYEETKVYEIRSYINEKGFKSWDIKDSSGKLWSDLSSFFYPNQPGSPSRDIFISVANTEISINDNYGESFKDDKTLGDDLNQSELSSMKLKINRVSGEWTIVDERNTYWHDESNLRKYSYTKGKCKKGQRKF